jgi:hypothetical protein
MSNINTEFNLLSMANHNEGIQESLIVVSSQQYFSSFTWEQTYKSEARASVVYSHSDLKKLYTEPSIGASYQISVHLAIQFQRRRFRNRPIRNKNCLW